MLTAGRETPPRKQRRKQFSPQRKQHFLPNPTSPHSSEGSDTDDGLLKLNLID